MAQAAPLPPNETDRLRRLTELGVLDTDAEPLFDALARAAALVVGTPIALVSLVDERRQWFKANVGLEGVPETSRDAAFCAHTLLDNTLMVVPDAQADPRFADNPLVTGSPDIRFYAGAPITLHDGLCMGALCVIDRQPRELDEHQRELLRQLARAVSEALEQRAMAIERNDALRREAQLEKLRTEDRERLATILEATQAGAWEYNAQTGELRFNEEWMRILGYQQGDVHLLPASAMRSLPPERAGERLAHPDDWPEIDDQLRRHLAGETAMFDNEARMRHQDGHWVWGHTRGRLISRDEHGQPLWMAGTFTDISERKEIERRLRASEAFLERTGQLAGVGGWQLDIPTGELTWSEQTCRLHDLPVGTRPALADAIDYYAPEARAYVSEVVERSMREGTGWDMELPLITARGRHIWVRAVGDVEFEQGRAQRMVGALQDITLRKQAITALELSEKRFRKLFEESLGFISTHDLDGTILSINPAAATALGYRVGELLGRPFTDLLTPELHGQYAHYLERIRAESTASGLIHLHTKDGRARIWQYHNVVDEDGEEPYVLAYAVDVTERLLQEKQLRDLSERDALTGLYNRRYLEYAAASLTEDDSWGCIAVDLDHFKHINDTYGHQRGDTVLIEMARFLRRHVRPEDKVVRVGGDEFLVLLPHADDGQLQVVLDRLDAAREQAPIGFSLGSAVRHGGQSLDEALLMADQQLYRLRSERGHRSSRE